MAIDASLLLDEREAIERKRGERERIRDIVTESQERERERDTRDPKEKWHKSEGKGCKHSKWLEHMQILHHSRYQYGESDAVCSMTGSKIPDVCREKGTSGE